MKKGRRKDHIWRFVKYLGDAAIYAKCSCGFRYRCDKGINGSPIGRDPDANGLYYCPICREPDANKLYYYCPICGSRKTRYIEKVERINKYSFE